MIQHHSQTFQKSLYAYFGKKTAESIAQQKLQLELQTKLEDLQC